MTFTNTLQKTWLFQKTSTLHREMMPSLLLFSQWRLDLEVFFFVGGGGGVIGANLIATESMSIFDVPFLKIWNLKLI